MGLEIFVILIFVLVGVGLAITYVNMLRRALRMRKMKKDKPSASPMPPYHLRHGAATGTEPAGDITRYVESKKRTASDSWLKVTNGVKGGMSPLDIVVMSNATLENATKARYAETTRTIPKEVDFMTMVDTALSSVDNEEMRWFRALRHRVVHAGKEPSRDEAERAFSFCQSVLRDIL